MDVRGTNRRVIEQFRAGGPIEGMHRDRLLLLTTTGARSGRAYTTPMMSHRDGERPTTGRVIPVVALTRA